MNKYPIYIISKGRWERRQTVKTLDYCNVDYRIVVEPCEFLMYKEHIAEKKILVLPSNFSEQKNGSIPVRNWVWEHSINEGYTHHWILDDNIESIERFNNNLKIKCRCPTPFFVIERFIDRYKNIALSGMNYAIFCPANEARKPFYLNTRIYSCILINNSIPIRWRGKYNEDTDLSIRALKLGYCTLLFNAFLIGKRATLTQKGGNAKIYDETNKRKEFAESLVEQHPDVAKVVWRFNRWHHHVNYKPFKKNKLIRVDNYDEIVKDGINNYGMKLIKKEDYKPTK